MCTDAILHLFFFFGTFFFFFLNKIVLWEEGWGERAESNREQNSSNSAFAQLARKECIGLTPYQAFKENILQAILECIFAVSEKGFPRRPERRTSICHLDDPEPKWIFRELFFHQKSW